MIAGFDQFANTWSELHGDATTKGIVGGWLKISYSLGRILTKLKLSANSLTFFGLVFAFATACFSPHWVSAFFLACSLICDGLDGSLAILQGRANKIGAVYDAIADRLSEALWLVALFRLDVPVGWVLAVGSLAAFQEYARARLGSDGVKEVGVVTPAERPVRASFLFVSIMAWQFTFSHGWVLVFVVTATFLQFVSFLAVIRFAKRSLN